MNKSIKITGWILLGIVFIVTAFVFLQTLILSVQDYNVMRGLLGSSWVGFKNFSEIFSSTYLIRIFTNTITISAIGSIIGVFYVFWGICAIGSFKNNFLKALFAIIFTVPAIIPNSLYPILLGTEILIKPSFLLQVLAGAADSLKIAALFIPAVFVIKTDTTKNALKCALMFLGIRLIFFLCVDTTYLYNPVTYEVLDTFSNFTYRKGIGEANFSYSAALFIIKTAFQVVFAFIGCVIAVSAEKVKTDKIAQKRTPAFSVFAVIPAFILIYAIIFGSGGAKTMTSMLINHYFLGMLEALMCALFISVVAFFAANAVTSSGLIGSVIITLLCVISFNQIGSYFIIRQIGFINSHIGVLMENLKFIPLLTLIFSCILKCADNYENNVTLFIAGAGIMFARFWGDSSAAKIILTDRNKYPVSVIMEQIGIQAQNQTTQAEPFAAVLYILIPLIVVGVAFAVGAILKNKEKN